MGQPLFSPSSVFWRVNRELASGLAGPRAVLMQIAHPLVAAGVAEHSRFRQHRLARLYRTSMAAAAITFGSREFALRAIRSVNEKRSEEHTSELQSRLHLVCRLLLEKKKKTMIERSHSEK